MAVDGIRLDVKGLPELQARLKALPAKLRARALRNALAAGARIVRDEAKRRAPVLRSAVVSKGKTIRKPGTLRDNIAVRTSKAARRAGNVGVFVNVRPAKRGQRGAKSPNDPFYWRFVNFGTSKKPQGAGFLEAAVGKLSEALRRFEQVLGPQIQKLDKGGKL